VQKPPGAHQNKRRRECRSQKRGRAPGHKGKVHHPGTATGAFALSPLNIANIQTLLQQVFCSRSQTLLQQVLGATVKLLTGRRLSAFEHFFIFSGSTRKLKLLSGCSYRCCVHDECCPRGAAIRLPERSSSVRARNRDGRGFAWQCVSIRVGKQVAT